MRAMVMKKLGGPLVSTALPDRAQGKGEFRVSAEHEFLQRARSDPVGRDAVRLDHATVKNGDGVL